MKQSSIIINAASSVIQIVITSITLFLLYKYLLVALGASQLGIWSLVLSTTSIAQLANFGITGSIVKYVAKYKAIGDTDKLSILIQTAAISIAVIFVVLAIIIYPVADYYLKITLQGESYRSASNILPYALIAFWIMMVTSISQAGLYGCQLITHRNLILAGESVTFLIICWFMAPRYGLVGLAYARLIQNCITSLVTWYILKKNITTLPLIPFRWEKSIFKEIIGYSVNFQFITLLVMLCDPVTKGLLSRYGSVSMVGYYEMANRMVQQVRSLIVNANQVLVPAFAHLKELAPERIQDFYIKSYQLLFFISLPVFSVLIMVTPFVSEIWIGRYESIFVTSAIILCVGWFLNTLSVPAYYACLGTGDLKWNLYSHMAMGASNLIIGLWAGKFFNGIGVIAAWAFSLALGGAILNITYHKFNKLPISELLPSASRLLALFCCTGIFISYLVSVVSFDSVNAVLFRGAVILLFIIATMIPVWVHPLRREIMGWLAKTKFSGVAVQ